MDLKATLNLPDANATIPMKANLPSLEPAIQRIWEEQDVYHRIQEARKDAPVFVLHDGPPYTNSPIHLGTALNKSLKDFVVKSRTMMGFRCPYVPGFDTHGLPIEQAVTRKLNEKKIAVTGAELRKACREHVAEFIDVQTTQFRRLGVLGLWERPYATLDFRFEAEIVRVFKRLVEKGLVYRGLRPTLWSPTLRTALADTEIIYHDHTSKAIYVRFPLRNDPEGRFAAYPNLYTIIWTTTPWTIPSNQAVAFHPDFEYAIVRQGDVHYAIVDALVTRVAEVLGWEGYEVVARVPGAQFEGTEFRHPLFDRPSVSVLADYVTTEDGTGVVHTAPSHGRDDFFTGQKYGLPVPNTVDERGVLTAEAGEFAGTFYKDCDTVVVDALERAGALLKAYDYAHSYPYGERDGQPVIFRATEQWFVAIDPVRPQMLEEIEGVNWVPEVGVNRIEAMVRNRPDWCVSRQRPWGVGIPVFYGMPSRTPVLDPVAIEAVAKLVEREGSGGWFEREPHDILPEGYRHPETGETEFTKETDTLDVWFDSGSTSLIVLDEKIYPEWQAEGLHWPADLYLEGSDQHRGWFNTSLILGTAVKGGAPYKTVVTHGFVTDGEGRKMSKRLGNVIDPVKAADTHGADVLRYWVATVDWANDAPCSEPILKQCGDGYRNVRNALRFLLGNLKGYTPDANAELLPIDEWVIQQTDLLVADCVDAYERYDFGAVMHAVHDFCRETLSKFYMDVIKDRMYCDAAEWPSRRSGQAACLHVLKQLTFLVAPVLCHTAEETWRKLDETVGGAEGTVHAQRFDAPTPERRAEIEGSDLQARFRTLLSVRDEVNAAFERYKGTDDVKDSQDAVVAVTAEAETLRALQSFDPGDLATMLRVSWVDLHEGPMTVEFRRSEYAKCERSRLRRPDVETVTIDGEPVALTARDRRALGVA